MSVYVCMYKKWTVCCILRTSLRFHSWVLKISFIFFSYFKFKKNKTKNNNLEVRFVLGMEWKVNNWFILANVDKNNQKHKFLRVYGSTLSDIPLPKPFLQIQSTTYNLQVFRVYKKTVKIHPRQLFDVICDNKDNYLINKKN